MKKVKNDVLERFEDFSRNFKSNFKSIPGGIDNIPTKLQLVSDFMENDFKVFCKDEFSKYDIDSEEREAVNEGIAQILIELQTMAVLGE